MKEVFWEKSYQNKEVSTFGNPSKEVEEMIIYGYHGIVIKCVLRQLNIKSMN